MNLSSLTLDDISRDPSGVSATLRLPSGGVFVFRPLEAKDAAILGRYFLGLSADTKRRYAPHPFDQATADALCAANNYHDTIRFIAVLPSTGEDRTDEVIAYFIFVPGVGESEIKRYGELNIPLDAASDCTLAPSVADAYQNAGLGSILMRHLYEVARRLGFRRMVLMGGVQAANERGVHYYKKHGFRYIGTFQNPPGFDNYDMIVDLC